MAKRAPTAGAAVKAPPKRELYLAFRSALTEGADAFESRIRSDWRGLRAAARADAAESRVAIGRILHGLKYRGGVLHAGTAQLVRARNAADAVLWDWMERQRKRLGLVRTARRGPATVEIMNVRYALDRGGVRRLIDDARADALEALTDASSPLRKAYGNQGKHFARRFLEGAERGDEQYLYGQGGSFVDNIVRSLEQAAHQASAHIVDATSGPMRAGAVAEAASRFDIPAGLMMASYLTHQRAAYRATIAAAGEAIEATEYAYYVPAPARPGMTEQGFTGRHYAEVRTAPDWDRVRRRLGHKRAGSFMFSTGFHVNDPGYLLPVPPVLAHEAREVERQRRQRELERLRRARRA